MTAPKRYPATPAGRYPVTGLKIESEAWARRGDAPRKADDGNLGHGAADADTGASAINGMMRVSVELSPRRPQPPPVGRMCSHGVAGANPSLGDASYVVRILSSGSVKLA